MYFKHMVNRVAKEIIKKEKNVCEKKGWELTFDLETIYSYEELVLTVKNSKNYEGKVAIDKDDMIEEYGKDSEKYIDLWVISDHVLYAINEMGFDTLG